MDETKSNGINFGPNCHQCVNCYFFAVFTVLGPKLNCRRRLLIQQHTNKLLLQIFVASEYPKLLLPCFCLGLHYCPQEKFQDRSCFYCFSIRTGCFYCFQELRLLFYRKYKLLLLFACPCVVLILVAEVVVLSQGAQIKPCNSTYNQIQPVSAGCLLCSCSVLGKFCSVADTLNMLGVLFPCFT